MAALLVSVAVAIGMVWPYLPGRFDASAQAISFIAQVAALAGLSLVPVGVAWLLDRRHPARWRRVSRIVATLIVVALVLAALTEGDAVLAVLVGAIGVLTLGWSRRADASHPPSPTLPWVLIVAPLVLVGFRATVIPAAADWSAGRVIRQSTPLIEAIERFKTRRGHYPVSLQALNHDVPTGVVGLERFRYEPSGEAYNLFVVRRHVALDAQEVLMYNPRDEHRFTSHELDILEHDGEALDLRRGDRRRSPAQAPHWVSILFD